MKTNYLLTAILLLMGFTVSAQTKSNDMELSEKKQSLVAIAAFEAKGDIDRLKQAVDNGLDNGLTVNEVKEALSHLYAYTGFPRSLNGLGALQAVLETRKAEGKQSIEGRGADPLAADYDALKQGTEVQTTLSGRPYNYTFAPQTDYYLKAHLFGDIFARNTLRFDEREIVTLAAISTLKGCDAQLRGHVSGALNMGVTEAELREMPMVLESKVGAVEAWRMRKAIAAVMKEPFSEGEPVDFNIWPKGELNTAYARYFIGNSYLAPMDAKNGGPVNVTFEPGCRNNWHIHHDMVQVLICVSGRGWYQEEGKEAVEMTPGKVIAIPAETKHWHGAAKDSWFQHLTYHTHEGSNVSTEWREPVTDEVYDKLK